MNNYVLIINLHELVCILNWIIASLKRLINYEYVLLLSTLILPNGNNIFEIWKSVYQIVERSNNYFAYFYIRSF